MRKVAVTLFFFMAVSLYGGNHDKLIGDWKFNVEKFKESKEYKDAIKDPQGGQMMQFMLGMFAKMSFTFTKTHTIANIPGPNGPQQEKTEYVVVSDSGDKLELKAKSPQGKEEVMVLTFIDDKNIRMEPKEKPKGPGPAQVLFLMKK